MPRIEDLISFNSGTYNVYLFSIGLIYIRCIVILNLTPFLGVRPVPNNVKGALSLCLALFIFPIISYQIKPELMPKSSFLMMLLFFKEAFFGLLIGFVVSFVFRGVEAAGSMIDNQRYVANARVFNPALGTQTSIFGNYYYWLTISFFILVGGHLKFIEGLIKSFQTVPVLSFPKVPTAFGPDLLGKETAIDPLLELILRISADTLIICLQLAAPVIIAIFIADLLLGLMNRIAPMVNVFEMGFNLKGFVGVLLVYFSIPLLVEQINVWFKQLFLHLQLIAKVFV